MKFWKTVGTVGAFVGTFYLGKGCSSSDESNFVGNYQLRTQDEQVQVYNKSLDLSKNLTETKNMFFLGDAKDNALGAYILMDQKR